MIAAAAAYELARKDEASLVKNVWLFCTMFSHECASIPFGNLEWYEKQPLDTMTAQYNMNALNGWQNQLDDPYLFPGKMPMDMMKKLPPTIVYTSEFCNLRRDAIKVIRRLEEAGVLLDYFSMANACHGYELMDRDLAEAALK